MLQEGLLDAPPPAEDAPAEDAAPDSARVLRAIEGVPGVLGEG